MKEKKQPDPLPALDNSFVHLLSTLREGEHAADASDALHRLVAAVRETTKRGKITITLELVPMDDEGATVKTLVRVEEKLPKPDRRASLMFTTEDGRLQRDDPNQLKMKLTVVDAKSGTPVETQKEIAANG